MSELEYYQRKDKRNRQFISFLIPIFSIVVIAIFGFGMKVNNNMVENKATKQIEKEAERSYVDNYFEVLILKLEKTDGETAKNTKEIKELDKKLDDLAKDIYNAQRSRGNRDNK